MHLLFWIAFLLPSFALAGSTSSRCVEGYYFHDGWCLGIASTSATPSFNKQFTPSGKSYCEKKYPHAAEIQPAVLRHSGQAVAMQKILAAGEATSLLTGWIPYAYQYQSTSAITEVIDQITKVTFKVDKLSKRLGVTVYTGDDCSDDYSSYSYSYQSQYLGEKDEYTSYSLAEGNYITDEYASYSSKEGDYTSEFYKSDPYSQHSGYFYYGSVKPRRNCRFRYPLAMKSTGEITAVNNPHRALVQSKPPVCMYEIPARESEKTCGNLLATKGYCLFTYPLDTRKTSYDGDWSERDNVSEYQCYSSCLNLPYCKAYEFYGSTVDSGTCELHFQVPTSTKKGTDAANLVRKCVVLTEPSECNGNTPSNPATEPTSSPTPYPTSRPTSKPTARPTADPTSRPTARPTPQPTSKPTARPTSKPTAQPTKYPTARPTPAPTNMWTSKCRTTNIVELETAGEWTTLGTNLKKAKYNSNTDLCWLIRAPKAKYSVTFQMDGGVTQADKDVMKVYDVDSTVSDVDTFYDDLRSGDIELTLRESYSGKINGVSQLDPQTQNMLINFYSDGSKRYSGLVFEVAYNA